jgi:hypothetical protein
LAAVFVCRSDVCILLTSGCAELHDEWALRHTPTALRQVDAADAFKDGRLTARLISNNHDCWQADRQLMACAEYFPNLVNFVQPRSHGCDHLFQVVVT